MRLTLYAKFYKVVIAASLVALSGAAFAADDSETRSAAPGTASSQSEVSDVAKLKAQVAAQQEQLESLRGALEEQKRMIDGMMRANGATVANGADPLKPGYRPASLGEVASLSPMVPAGSPSPNAIPAIPAAQKTAEQVASPLSLQIGSSYLTPLGFMDFTTVNRTTVGGGGIGSNFGSIPYNNVQNGHLSEQILSAQNSRVGFRFDSLFHDTHVLGYLESDFLGNNPGNVAVSSNSNTMRMRLYFVDLQKGNIELLAGQTWSLLTPSRTGISPIPGNIFFSNDIDVNYQAGLVWGRVPELRLVYHSTNRKFHAAFALDEPQQYVGGSAGGSTITPPANVANTVFTQFNNGTQTLSTPNLAPDVVVKFAWDPSSRFHGEVSGVERTFKTWDPVSNRHYTKAGGGFEVNFGAEVFKGLRIVTNNYASDGGGRWIFGQAPDVVVRSNGDFGLVHSYSTVSGPEYTWGKTLFYGYYGGIYISKNTTIDSTTGKPVGYGYTGSPNSQNRTIQEATFGFNQTVWKDAKYGAINFMGQYSWLSRNPWYVALNAPKNAHQSMVYFNLRYSLPGSAPTLK